MIDKLSLLIGVWKGKGTANYPTIEKTEYIEELEFQFTGDGETIMFSQRTWFLVNGEKGAPLHLESGFIIAYPDGSYELLDAQNSKRVEVMKSSNVSIDKAKLQISFESKYFGNDERMIRTVRDYIVEGNSLRYEMKMGTQKTEFQKHLEAVLIRRAG